MATLDKVERLVPLYQEAIGLLRGAVEAEQPMTGAEYDRLIAIYEEILRVWGNNANVEREEVRLDDKSSSFNVQNNPVFQSAPRRGRREPSTAEGVMTRSHAHARRQAQEDAE
jgi:hypothetical protein